MSAALLHYPNDRNTINPLATIGYDTPARPVLIPSRPQLAHPNPIQIPTLHRMPRLDFGRLENSPASPSMSNASSGSEDQDMTMSYSIYQGGLLREVCFDG